MSAGSDENEKASVEKNIGLAHFAISSSSHLSPLEMADHNRDAIKFLSLALRRGKSTTASERGSEWAEKVDELIYKVLKSGMEKVSEVCGLIFVQTQNVHFECVPVLLYNAQYLVCFLHFLKYLVGFSISV